MAEKKKNQSDYMSLQLMQIENLRQSLSRQSHESVTFQEAATLWISGGYADQFMNGIHGKGEFEPALA